MNILYQSDFFADFLSDFDLAGFDSEADLDSLLLSDFDSLFDSLAGLSFSAAFL